MVDPARGNDLLKLLSFVHPAVISVGVLGALLVLNTGLALRQLRVRGKIPPAGTWRWHTRWAPLAVGIVVVGFVLGPLSSVFIRQWSLFATFHGWVGLAATVSFCSVAVLGRRLKLKETRRAQWHGLLGLLSIGLALLAAITGIELLP